MYIKLNKFFKDDNEFMILPYMKKIIKSTNYKQEKKEN